MDVSFSNFERNCVKSSCMRPRPPFEHFLAFENLENKTENFKTVVMSYNIVMESSNA
jgi:hypothetical protein